MTDPRTEETLDTWAHRYRAIRKGFRWHVVAGTGTRSLAKCFFWRTAERLAQELQTAFYDGRYVGQNGLTPREFTR